jgi:hypothetical protein
MSQNNDHILIRDLCQDNAVRVMRIIHLGALAAHDESDLDDELVLNAEPDGKAFAPVRAAIPELAKAIEWQESDDYDGDRIDSFEDFVNFVLNNGYLGFLIEVHTPVVDEDGDLTGGSYIGYAYGESLLFAVRHAVEWAKTMSKPLSGSK